MTQLGIDNLLLTPELFDGKRIGAVLHQASVLSDGTPTVDALAPYNLTTLFGPEHGITTVAQDMEGVGHNEDAARNIPIYSLYGDSFASLKPQADMCNNMDVFIIDLQDIGSRYYTYIYTMAFCMQTAAATGKPVIVCDRPNPINGTTIEGGLIDKGFHSFVGLYPLPVRHAMTIGELARYFNDTCGIDCDLKVIPMTGWKRDMLWNQTGLSWINPSPNMRSLNAALLYPGMCLLEGTNVSEGRGTATPFELCGAPWIDSEKLAKQMSDLKLPGIEFTPTEFTPTFQKHTARICHGIKFTITNQTTLRPYETGVALIAALATHKGFAWRTERYEFVDDIPAIDLLTGSSRIRKAIDHQESWSGLRKLIGPTPADFLTTRERYLMY
ncbi:MAG: hypothetical protein COV45_04055 [Deltaproteobacteria bacterium CG11_big_fil_rev_8_21_14_0_20_47_16]|nr:MAG: hypothetical protein COV45_04055 [Deltaproteobacteria bacterium CG11_big_fil_rev_8_21_14_0_20_47_16]